jgi:hypothetical protein
MFSTSKIKRSKITGYINTSVCIFMTTLLFYVLYRLPYTIIANKNKLYILSVSRYYFICNLNSFKYLHKHLYREVEIL